MNPTDTVAIFIAGLIWPYVFQVLGKFHLSDRSAQWAAVVFSYVIAAVVIVGSGQGISPTDIISGGSVLAVVSQVVYRQIIKPGAMPPPITPPAQPTNP